MRAGRLVRFGLVAVLWLLVLFDLWPTLLFKNAYDRLYMSKLDGWVNAGGPIAKKTDVLDACSQLVMTQAGPVWAPYMLIDRAEFTLRTDMCYETVVNRVYPQPRFKDPKIVSIVCDNENDLFRDLCRHFKLRVQ